MTQQKLKVLYLFAGERRRLLERVALREAPDSELIGLNHLAEAGIGAEFLETDLSNRLRKFNYNFAYLPYLWKIRSYDVVFSGSSLLFPFIAKVLCGFRRPKFVWYNTFFTNALLRNRRGVRKFIIRKTIACLDAVVCPTTAQRDFLIKEGFNPAKIFFVKNGVDVNWIKKSVLSAGQKVAEPYILSVGKDMGRDYKTLVEAVKGLNIKLKIAALPRNLAGISLPDNVEFLGFVAQNELAALYKNALFVVLPTKRENEMDASDCSGQYALLDAMAAGKAVIASRRATLPAYLVDGKEGVVVSPEDVSVLRKAIEKLLSSPAEVSRLGAEAARRAAENFTTEKLAKDLSAIFFQTTA